MRFTRERSVATRRRIAPPSPPNGFVSPRPWTGCRRKPVKPGAIGASRPSVTSLTHHPRAAHHRSEPWPHCRRVSSTRGAHTDSFIGYASASSVPAPQDMDNGVETRRPDFWDKNYAKDLEEGAGVKPDLNRHDRPSVMEIYEVGQGGRMTQSKRTKRALVDPSWWSPGSRAVVGGHGGGGAVPGIVGSNMQCIISRLGQFRPG